MQFSQSFCNFLCLNIPLHTTFLNILPLSTTFRGIYIYVLHKLHSIQLVKISGNMKLKRSSIYENSLYFMPCNDF
jgi:hypothetical protein